MADASTRLAYIKSIRDWLAADRQQLAEHYLKRPLPDRYLRGHASLVDEVISRIAEDIGIDSRIALLAVGGYGRGYLFPASDIDVLVLLPNADLTNENADNVAINKNTIEAFVSLLWDVGLEPGISVRTLAECVEEAGKDVTVDTSILEARLITGNADLAAHLHNELTHARDPRHFLAAKLEEQRQRHAKHNDVALNLEPNIKESPGGLRDLQTVLWIARAGALGNDWASLVANGLITAEEATLVTKHRRVLIDLRIRLHLQAKRREDRLVFDHQMAIAEQLKLKPTKSKRATEVLMQRYYLSAKAIWQLNSILLANLSERITAKKRDTVKPIDANFELVNGNIAAIEPHIFARDPRAIFRAFLALQNTPEAEFFSADTLRALWREVPRIGPAFRADAEVNQLFLAILKSDRLSFTLRRMSRYGILGRYLPAFGRIVGLMQHDLFHVYTVDEHILMVLRNMRRLVLPRFAHEFPFCHSLARDFADVHLLYLACLFHDIAKGRGGDHSALGMNDARRFCRQLGLPRADGEFIAWLVDMHLVMSSTAQKQDLSEPEVISQFAAKVATERRLIALYLLTVADIRGTSPHVWNGWKARLLEELFRATRKLLRGESEINTHWIDYKRRDTLAQLATNAPPPIWSVVDDRYFERFDVDDIAWHAQCIGSDLTPASARVHVKIEDASRTAEASEPIEVLVMASDRAGLFARITAAFERLQLDIVSARIYTSTHGYALDTFLVMPKSRSHRTSMEYSPRITRELPKAIAESMLPQSPTARTARQVKHFPITPEIVLKPSRIKNCVELSIICADRPGLLSGIARILHEADISLHDARITTLGSRAEDIFVIEGGELNDGTCAEELKRKLLAAVG
jgi:[protein-PII] uridylyltransferase